MFRVRLKNWSRFCLATVCASLATRIPVVQKVLAFSQCPVQTFGTTEGATWRVGKTVHSEKGVEFELFHKRRSVGTFQSALFGDHNILNIVSGIAVASNLGDTTDRIRAIVPKFNGCKRRQQILLDSPVVLVDDFAHHPTEVKATLTACTVTVSQVARSGLSLSRGRRRLVVEHTRSFIRKPLKPPIIALSEPYRKNN
jgi:UDP-N-acetylmuramate-alanine ligase